MSWFFAVEVERELTPLLMDVEEGCFPPPQVFTTVKS